MTRDRLVGLWIEAEVNRLTNLRVAQGRQTGTPGPEGRSASVQKAYLRSRANPIEGGSSEIIRNILGERVLGLPADVRVDKDVPWSRVPRS